MDIEEEVLSLVKINAKIKSMNEDLVLTDLTIDDSCCEVIASKLKTWKGLRVIKLNGTYHLKKEYYCFYFLFLFNME